MAEENLPAKREDSPFVVVKAHEERVRDIIQLNLGGKKVTAFDLDRIKVPSGSSSHWDVPTLDGNIPQETIEGVVIHFRDMRAWWPDLEPTGKPPSCRSEDTIRGLGSRECGDKYKDDPAAEYHDCETCLYAKFGSDPKAGRGQWCKQMRALFILTEKLFLPVTIFLPPTSIKSVEKYFFRLGAYGVPFNSVVTSFKLSKEKNDDGQSYNRVEAQKSRRLSEEEYDVIRSYTEVIKPAFEQVKIEADDIA